jgi:molybdate transport system substrate-binding protein
MIALGRVRIAVLAALTIVIAASGPAPVDDIRLYSGGAPQLALRLLAAEFEKQSGHRVQPTFALITVIQDKLAAGEKADLILLPVPLINTVEKTTPLRAEGRTVIARVGIGVIVRRGMTPPDISTPDAVRKLLLEARAIAFPEPSTPSGNYLGRMVAQLGIADAVSSKIVIKAAIQGGGELVAKGDVDVGMYLTSEVRNIDNVTIVGPLPSPLQSFVVYGAAIPAANMTPEPALEFLKFVTDPAKSGRWTEIGFEMVAARN